MLTQEVASLVHFIDALELGIVKRYFGEVPESFAVPSIYYPTPEIDNRGFSTGSYEKVSVIFLKVYDSTSVSSNAIAQKIVDSIMQAKRNIPFYNNEGSPENVSFRVYDLETRNIDAGVTQIEISYKNKIPYVEPEQPKADNIYIDGLPTNILVEEDDEDVTEK